MRVELTTFSLATRCSTTELHPPGSVLASCLNRGRYYKYPLFIVKCILYLYSKKLKQSVDYPCLRITFQAAFR